MSFQRWKRQFPHTVTWIVVHKVLLVLNPHRHPLVLIRIMSSLDVSLFLTLDSWWLPCKEQSQGDFKHENALLVVSFLCSLGSLFLVWWHSRWTRCSTRTLSLESRHMTALSSSKLSLSQVSFYSRVQNALMKMMLLLLTNERLSCRQKGQEHHFIWDEKSLYTRRRDWCLFESVQKEFVMQTTKKGLVCLKERESVEWDLFKGKKSPFLSCQSSSSCSQPSTVVCSFETPFETLFNHPTLSLTRVKCTIYFGFPCLILSSDFRLVCPLVCPHLLNLLLILISLDRMTRKRRKTFNVLLDYYFQGTNKGRETDVVDVREE